MAILIGHASIDENGKISGGTSGDQTQKEVCIRMWYSKPWGFVLRCKDSSKAEKMAIACEQGCANDYIGYDQYQRNTLNTQAKTVSYDLSKIKVPCECDCSSFVTVCALAAGVKITYGTNAPTTSTMQKIFTSTGEFDVLTDSKYLTSDDYLKRGDILVKAGSHTAIALENGNKATRNKIGIDVSSYQGIIDWNAVKASGIDFAILKIIRKDLAPDNQFFSNWNGCLNAGIVIQGVYNYSYATTTQKAQSDAKKVLEILGEKEAMVWLDVEDNCQKNIGSNLIAIINAYKAVIEGAGLQFGVYTNESFYNSYIKPYGTPECPLWIARYGKNTGDMDLNYQPQISGMIGWQYTSVGKVNGISGNVDMNIWYDSTENLPDNPITFSNPYPEPTRLLYKISPMMTGDDVKWLQAYLIEHGCLAAFNSKGKSNVDGIFGSDTDTAVRKFQTQSGIAIDGKVGAITRAYLKS